MTIQSVAARVEKFAVDNSPLILTSIGVGGVVGTAILTGKASYKAAILIDREEAVAGISDDPKQVLKERTKLVWKLYIPPALSAGFTVVAIVGANRIGTRRAAAMAAAYSLSERAFEEYREKIVEKLNPEKERAVRDEIAQDRVNANPASNNSVIVTAGGDVMCYDHYSGRYFRSDMETIKKAMNDLNYMVINNGYASLNDFYDKLGMDRSEVGEEVGWTSDELLDIYFSTTISDEQVPCIAIDFQTKPVRNYFRLH